MVPRVSDEPRGAAVTAKKELKELLDEAERQGWTIKPTKNGRQLLAPDGVHIVTVHGTPGKNAIRHYVRDMRKYGFEWKGR